MQPPIGNLIFIGLIFIVFWFLMIRPQKKLREAQRAMIMSLEEGDEIVTAGGILGTIQLVHDDHLSLEISPGTTIRILKSAVARKISADEPDEEEEEYVDEEEEQA